MASCKLKIKMRQLLFKATPFILHFPDAPTLGTATGKHENNTVVTCPLGENSKEKTNNQMNPLTSVT